MWSSIPTQQPQFIHQLKQGTNNLQEMNFLAAAFYQSQQQQLLIRNQQTNISKVVTTPVINNPSQTQFLSSFSVNSLLNNNNNALYQQHQHQMTNAAFSKHIASALAVNYHLQKLQQNDGTFQQPTAKKYKKDDHGSSSNSSVCSSTSLLDVSQDCMSGLTNQQIAQKPLDLNINDKQSYDESEFYDVNNTESFRGSASVSNKKQRKIDLKNLSCPICDESLNLNQIQSHIEIELSNLENSINLHNPDRDFLMQSINSDDGKKTSSIECDVHTNHSVVTSPKLSNRSESKARYLNFLKIKENRKIRLKRKLYSSCKEVLCPICIIPVSGTIDEINFHLDTCKPNTSSNGELGIIENGIDSEVTSSNSDIDTQTTSGNSNESIDDTKKRFKCQNCINPNDNPFVSVKCWHVNCKKCWMLNLNMNNSCPQCKLVTTADDLKVIYL